MKAVNAFHAHLPLDKMQEACTTGHDQAMWHDVARPHFSNFVHETGRGVVGIVSQPVRGYKENGNCHKGLTNLWFVSPDFEVSQSV